MQGFGVKGLAVEYRSSKEGVLWIAFEWGIEWGLAKNAAKHTLPGTFFNWLSWELVVTLPVKGCQPSLVAKQLVG